MASPSFSICFIGRNEAKTLPRALDSIEEFIDRGGEVCYLDTGSTDGTPFIAERYGARVEAVGDRFLSEITPGDALAINERFVVDAEDPVVKQGDKLFRFDDARNYCADRLATNDMVSWMDCDEVVTKMDIDKIESLIKEGFNQFEYNFVYAHGDNGEEVIKFVQSKFYNKQRMIWTGIIHEVLAGKGNRKFLEESIFKLEHYQNVETNRGGYLKGLALDCFRRQKEDRQSHYFAREMMWHGRPKSAMKEFARHLTLGVWPPERAQSMIYIGDCLLTLGKESEAIQWLHKAFQEDGGRREALIKLAYLYTRRGEWMRVASYCEAALVIPWAGYYMNNKAHYEYVPHELLGEAYWMLGNREKSKEHFDIAATYRPQGNN